MRSTPALRNWSQTSNPDLIHFPVGNFLTSSAIIVSSVSGNSLRANMNDLPYPSDLTVAQWALIR